MRTFIKSIDQGRNTGGNIFNDIITLSNGFIVAISEDSIGIYKSEKDYYDSECEAGANFSNEDQLDFMTDSEIDNVYTLNVGYRPIADENEPRESVVNILKNWQKETGEPLKF